MGSVSEQLQQLQTTVQDFFNQIDQKEILAVVAIGIGLVLIIAGIVLF